MSNETIQGIEVYQEQINIELFNDIIAFVAATTARDLTPVRKRLNENHLWYSQSDSGNIQARYGFRYLGELLERFEDKVGSDIRNIRAVALAMASTKDLFTDDMFVGGQKAGFIKKITRLSPDDIYLKGALYLLGKDERGAEKLLEELKQAAYTRTEEMLFIVSLMDSFEQAMRFFKPQLIGLLGAGRTMPVFGNLNVYGWLIKNLHHYHMTTGIRAKDMVLFRALFELPISFVKSGSRYHTALLDNKYSADEILYLNSGIINCRPIPDTIRRDSIVAEKIAVQFCKTFLNSENTHHEEVYQHLESLMKMYDRFFIKLNGVSGIFDAIKEELEIVNPQTFLRLYNLIIDDDRHDVRGKISVFRFDILEEKWDILSRKMKPSAYLDLFELLLADHAKLSGKKIRKWIQKYDALTGAAYLALFEKKHTYARDDIFSLLVEKGIIDIQAAFAACSGKEDISEKDPDDAKPQMLHYLHNYLKGIHSRKAFDFFKSFLNEYSFDDMHRFFTESSYGRDKSYFFMRELYSGPSYSYGDKSPRFSLKRGFLTDDEHRELLGWLDDYIFQYKTDEYVEFATLMLLDPFITTLFPQTELRRIFEMFIGADFKVVRENARALKERYLSEAELQAERDAEAIRQKAQKQQAKEQLLQKLRDEIKGAYNGSFQSLLKFLSRNTFNQDHALRIAAGYLEPALTGKDYLLTKEDITDFLSFSRKLFMKGIITFDGIAKHFNMIKEADQNAENNTTPELDIDDDDE